MAKKLAVLGSLVLVALMLVTFTGMALAQPPTPTVPYRGFGIMGGVTLQQVADLLGTTPTEVAAQLREGKTLAQIAQAKGVTEQALTDAILKPFKDRLALQVKYGYLTQEQADAWLQQQQTWIKEHISTAPGAGNGWCPMLGGGWGGFGGMMGPRGMMSFGGRGMMGWQ